MNWWQFIIPDNEIAKVIWLFLLAIFLVWFALFCFEFVRLFKKKEQIRASVDEERLKGLEEALHKKLSSRATETEDETQKAKLNVALGNFYLDARIEEDFVIAKHIRTIFEAGWRNSQLQVEALIKNTTNRLFRRNSLLRSSLSLFIVVGLLGTLFGLAHSLAELSPAIPNVGQIVDRAEQAKGLSNLLNQLRGAFAPSIWGVGLTIVGVLLFSYYLHLCQLVKDELEFFTLSAWVPALYPSPLQQQLSALVDSQELIHKNRESFEKVAVFAANIKTEIQGVVVEIESSRTTLRALNESSSKINDFADKFNEGVKTLTLFQKDLVLLYKTMLDDSKVFQEGVKQSLSNTTEIQRQASATLTEQNTQLREVVQSLHSYEGAYGESRKQLDASLKTVLEDVRNAYQDIGERNKEISVAINESLSVPLRTELASKLDQMQTTLTDKLSGILNQFGAFDTPITNAAQDFKLAVQAVNTQMNEVLARLQHEYVKQNEANSDQLKKLEGLNTQLAEFLASLTKITAQQETSYTNMSQGLPGLDAKVATLTETVERLLQKDFSANETATIDTSGIERGIRDASSTIVREFQNLSWLKEEMRKLQKTSNGQRAHFRPDEANGRVSQPPPSVLVPESKKGIVSRVKGFLLRRIRRSKA
jgi:hypothetical protein